MATEISVGTTIRRARERKRMSQAELAKVLGVSRSAVNAWENDRTYPLNSIGAIEEALDVNLTDAANVVTPGASPSEDREELRDQLRRLEDLAREVRERLDEQERREYDEDRRRRGA